MGGRRGLVARWLALLVVTTFVGWPARADAEDASKTITGTAEWRNGKGDCNTGINVQNYVNGTGSVYAKVDMPTTVVVDGRHVSVAWRDPGGTHGPWFGPVTGDVADDGAFMLTGHNEFDPSWTWSGTLDGAVMQGTFTRKAIFATGQPPCTATWDVKLRLDKPLGLTDSDRATPAAKAKLCPTKVTDGALEPTQGVWQHDPGKFPDRPGARLKRETSTIWNAELPMVADRPTLVFGAPDHDTIRISGTTTGTTQGETTLHVFATDAGATLDTRLDLKGSSKRVGFFAPCGAKRDFVANVSVPRGLPENAAFTFADVGDYKITAQLESGGSKIDPPIMVTGKVVRTLPPKTLLVPVSLDSPPSSGTSDAKASKVVQDAQDVSAMAGKFIADFYPVASYQVDADKEVFYAGDALKGHTVDKKKADDQIEYVVSIGQEEARRRDELDNYDRVILFMSKSDYQRIDPHAPGSDGYAASQKMIVVSDTIGRKAGSGTATPATVAVEIAHETAHTLQYLWSAGEMKSGCSHNYHNVVDDDVAYGYRITLNGEEKRQAVNGRASLMSEIYADTNRDWIDQCTYANVLKQLSGG